MNVFNYFEVQIIAVLEALTREGKLPQGLDFTRVTVEPPRDANHGDLSTNAAMVLAKPAALAPRAIAEMLAERLRPLESVTEVSIAGPGFINLRLDDAFWCARIADVLAAGPRYGESTAGQGLRTNVEYVSANPTGPMHVGHCRGAVFGDALASLLVKAGYDVTREYYINDAGGQVDVLARSAYLRYREALGETISIPEGLYPGDYLVPVGERLKAEHGDRLLSLDEAEWLPIARDTAIDAMMALIREDLAALGIAHDVFFSERTLHASGRVEETLEALKAKGLIYQGVLAPPKGKLPDDWEERPQTLFRSTDFGDDVDRALKKSDGSWTYFAADIAYHRDKYLRGFRNQIDVWGADHSGYITRMQSAVKAISDGNAALDVKICQLVKLFRRGEPVRMSKRSGSFVTLRDVVDEVGRDVVRFMMLMRKNDAPLDFDFAKVTEQSKDNPVFYVQYAHARIQSVLRNAGKDLGEELTPALLAGAGLSGLRDEAELALIKWLAAFPRQVELGAEAHEPHRIAFYLYDLASMFHSLWNKGKDDPALRFIIADDRPLTLARLALISAVGHVIASGLAILGVEPAQEMR
ncbi:MAG: arginine--tRNA ligase [Parvibaculaceae bacterium]|nr:arginine--tRNA ligase [Parvibaculaceae bacterium]